MPLECGFHARPDADLHLDAVALGYDPRTRDTIIPIEPTMRAVVFAPSQIQGRVLCRAVGSPGELVRILRDRGFNARLAGQASEGPHRAGRVSGSEAMRAHG
ncbi:hypothetical protein [Thioalkalivibrio sp. ALE16]|uniref:hypothetical protein n=1 Tax=Thioalkalivibrio sp. ALE16 TaxID=1158172 RepID=UPI000369E19B|nr:hypothetical protein [Thioalkalivibrio sp. ALE16]